MSLINQHKTLFFDLEVLQSYLGGRIEIINGIHTLNFNNSNGKGRIRYLAFDDGLLNINVDLLLSKNFTFSLNHSNIEVLHFIFCLEGNCSHSFENASAIRRLDELQTAVCESNNHTKNSIHIRPNIRTLVNIVSIDKTTYFKNKPNASNLPKTKLLDLLNVLNLIETPIHFGTYNLKIGEYVKLLLDTNVEDKITELMRFEGISYFILANHIEQLYEESIQSTNTSMLTGTELKSISSVSEVIKTNPQEPYTINMLCRITRLSPAKLQEGFKALNNRTVSDHIRHIRLRKAENLIKTTDLNISEIVYSIGFTSRSYFCKIFKAEYGCSPKQYKKKTKSTGVLE